MRNAPIRASVTIGLALFGAVLLAPATLPPPPLRAAEISATLPPDPGEEGPLVAEGDPPDLALVYTGGVVGYVEPCG